MVNTTDYVKHTSVNWGKDDKNKAIDKNKFSGELADFIPDYSGPNITAGAFDSRLGSKTIDPSKYRGSKGMKAKSGYYKAYKSTLSAAEAPSAPVGAEQHHKGKLGDKPVAAKLKDENKKGGNNPFAQIAGKKPAGS
jgi:hypothetical protein